MQIEKKLDHINLKVPNLEAAIEFYTKTLNFHIKDKFAKDGREFVFITDGKIIYELIEDKNLEHAYFDHIAYESNDIQKDYNYYKNLNPDLILTEVGFVDFLFEHGVDYFFIQGPGNEKIEFCQKRRGSV